MADEMVGMIALLVHSKGSGGPKGNQMEREMAH